MMHIIRDFEHCPGARKGAAVALGNFDGVHRGHQAILKTCIDQARKNDCPSAVMTFEPHPREFFAKDKAPLKIYPLHKKLRLLSDAGIDIAFLARFNRALAALAAHEFVGDILHKQLGVRHVVTGYDFAFGKGRGGNTDFLESEAKKLGFGFTRVQPVAEQDSAISSSAIRALLKEGDVARASRLLGRPYSIGGRVQKGDGRGHALGFPTANIRLNGLFTPRFGIYAARVGVGASWHDAVVSLGIRPMFPLKEPLLEVHCLSMNRDLYGQAIEVHLVEFIRDEEHFGGEPELSAQMMADCKAAETILQQRRKAAHG